MSTSVVATSGLSFTNKRASHFLGPLEQFSDSVDEKVFSSSSPLYHVFL